MKRIIIGSVLLVVATVFGVLDYIDRHQALTTVVYFVFWYGLLGYMIYGGYKAQKGRGKNV